MSNHKRAPRIATADRMGRFIGQLRTYEDIPLKTLASGLCSLDFLCKIENGEREAGKLLVDAFFQRLGKPAEMFERILDWSEFQQWKLRQETAARMRSRDVTFVRENTAAYLRETSGVLDRQFASIMEINCRHMEGASAEELLSMIYDALRLTQPDLFMVPLRSLLLSQNDGNLFFASLNLREKTEGPDAVCGEYRELLEYLKQRRYDSRERLYLLPYVACRVIGYDHAAGRYASALSLCEEVLEELTGRRRLFAYSELLQWKQRLFDAMGNPDQTPARLLEQLKLIQAMGDPPTRLLVPYNELGHVYCSNHVIRDRRKLLGLSQEELASGICDPATLSRIENKGGNIHRDIRRALLQRVNMSGERYDYEIITDRYEDYLLRSEIGEAYNSWDLLRVSELLDQIRKSLPDVPTNLQYIMELEASLKSDFPKDHPDKISFAAYCDYCWDAIQLTFPLDLRKIDSWPVTTLSLNEFMLFINYAFCLKCREKLSNSLSILEYVRRCMASTGADLTFYADLYTRTEMTIASALGDMGRHTDSTERANACLKSSLWTQNSDQIARCLYTIAWDIIQQPDTQNSEYPAEERTKARSFLKMAYAASIISGRQHTQEIICNFYLKTYRVPIEF